ncbi:hypothetical protein PVAND_015658 [Polypedilum vanderplanki]|uniref:Uncharacterized protein n=1 Tax=Polypedilum vanderplanki TaxID=319348 RepID=A0A9J6BDR6_POLVA|nr:hypothetical protein PVAND_015658 [Polypedilum vanderplanki]
MENTCENEIRKINIIVIGESNVGKSSLVRRFIEGEFYDDERPTILAETKYKNITHNLEKIELEIFDVSGLHDYRSLVSMIFRNLNGSNENRFGLILVYDVTCIKSFENLTKWYQQLELTDQCNIVKIVIGNKIDLRDNIKISIHRGQEFSKKFNAGFFETSAANDLNVQNAFESLIEMLLNDKEKERKNCFSACKCQ